MVTRPVRRFPWRDLAHLVVVAVVAVVAALAPEPVPLGASRLFAYMVLVAGAAVLVARVGAVDLATSAAAAAGAVAGGVGTALVGLPVLLGMPVAAAAGAAVGALSGALHGRVGRQLGALTSLAIGAAAVALHSAWRGGGGVVGFHAVGLPTGLGDRADALVVALLAVVALVVAVVIGRGRVLSAASVAVRAPDVAASLGRRAAGDVAVAGAAGGALLGVGGALLAAVDGSVVPAAFGLELAAALAVAAAVGGAGVAGPVVGTLLVWGPSTLWPLVPVVGTLPALVTTGPLALVLLGLRRGRPLLPHVPAVPARPGPSAPVPRRGPRALRLRGTDVPAGPVDLDVAPGEIVAVVGPNGAGKSTLLARIAGQLDDGGTVVLDGTPLPSGPRRRAAAGIGRTWQRTPELPLDDAGRAVAPDRAARAAAAWATTLLAPDAATAELRAGSDPAVAQLVRLAAQRPSVALLDEPTDVPVEVVLRFVRALADGGAAVVLVDHRPEVLATADRAVTVGPHPPDPTSPPPSVPPPTPGSPTSGSPSPPVPPPPAPDAGGGT